MIWKFGGANAFNRDIKGRSTSRDHRDMFLMWNAKYVSSNGRRSQQGGGERRRESDEKVETAERTNSRRIIGFGVC